MRRVSVAGKKMRAQLRYARIEDAPTNHEKIKLMLQYGTLAPSTHNTQPWQFEIKQNGLKVYIDFDKAIPIADPTMRDMYISIGALIKNVELAAHEFGVQVIIKYPKVLKKRELVAEMTFEDLEKARTPTNSALLQGILKRQNYRGFFKEEFDHTMLQEIVRDVITRHTEINPTITTDEEKIEALAQLTVRGLRMGYATQEFRHEISSYINHNLSRKNHGLHGHSLRLNLPQSLVIPKVMKRKDIGKKLGDLNYRSFIASPAVMVLSTKEDDERAWLATGQAMEEIMVRAAAKGMFASLYTASIEMGNLRSELAQTLGLTKVLPQVLFCIGQPSKPLPYSVRKDISKVLK